MSQPTPDGRAVVRALDALTTQVKRIADHTAQASFALAPPVVDTDDDVATTADDAVYCPLCPEAPLLLTPADATDHFRTVHPGQRLLGAGPWPQLATNDAATTCRRMETRTCPPSYNGPCGGRPCARFESDDPGPWLDTVAAPAPAADEDAQRTTRRASLHNLIVRATQGALTTDECAMLWRHVEAEQREADTARAVAAENKRHVQTIVPEIDRLTAERDRSDEAARRALEQRQEMAEERHAWEERGDRAEAAIKRVRVLHRPAEYIGLTICADCSGYDGKSVDNGTVIHPCDTIRALDGAEQPTTKLPRLGTHPDQQPEES